jgi:hypothetical protein
MSQTLQESAAKLKELCVGTHVGFNWPGQKKAVDGENQETMNDSVQAEPDGITSTRVLLDKKMPCISKINACRRKIDAWWKGMSWPYPETGTRLMKKEFVAKFEAGMPGHAQELYELACDVEAHREEVLAYGRKKQGRTFNESAYPPDFRQAYAVEHCYRNLNPPESLFNFLPEIYQAAKERAFLQFQGAVLLGEQAYAAKLAKLTDALHHALTPPTDGKKRVLRDAAVGNFQDFIEQFKSMSVGSSSEMDAAVAKLEGLLGNVSPEQLKKLPELKQSVVKGLEEVQAILPSLVVAKPRRAITLPTPKVVPAPDAQDKPDVPSPFEGPPAVAV